MLGVVKGVEGEEAQKFKLSLVEQHILGRVRFLAPTSTIERDQHTWVVWSLERWADLLGVSVSTVQRAVRKLDRSGLVCSERHCLGVAPKLFLRPKKEELETTDHSVKMTASEAEHSVKMTETCVYEKRQKDSMKEDSSGKPKSVAAVLPFLQQQAGAKLHTCAKPVSPTVLEQAWKAEWTARGIDGFCFSWNKAQLGMAKIVMQRCQEAGADAVAVVRTVVGSWAAVTQYAKAKEGAFPLPETPKLDWVVKYIASVIWFHMHSEPAQEGAQVAADASCEVMAPTHTKPKKVVQNGSVKVLD